MIKQFDESKEAVELLIKKSLLHENEHAVHVEWLERIQALREVLDNNQSFNLQQSIQNKLRERRMQLRQLKEDIKFEATVLMTR